MQVDNFRPFSCVDSGGQSNKARKTEKTQNTKFIHIADKVRNIDRNK